MKNFYKTFLAFSVLLSSTAVAKASYDPSQLQQFLQTNACPGCDLSGSVIFGDHSQAKLDRANLSDADMNNLLLFEAKLTNANLTGTNLINANLLGADFKGSELYGAHLDSANLYQANITPQQLAEAVSFCGAILPDGSEGKCETK